MQNADTAMSFFTADQDSERESPNWQPSWRTHGLQQLGGSEHSQIIDLIEKMRASQMSQYVDLPQLAVCGDQSSGKSSVLQAIAEIPFPQNSTTCTRFATEVIMRRAPMESVSIRICSHRPNARSPELVSRQQNFGSGVTDLQSVGVLAELIDNAHQAMDFSGGSSTRDSGFSRDVLRIEIAGPGRTPLVLVDLPGLIQVGDDAQIITELVEEYMSNPRTIILAIVTASNDLENQIILKKAKLFDPQGVRTLGIITKPDKLDKGSNLEKRFVGLAKNTDSVVRFDLGWHVLMNGSRPDGEMVVDFSRRGEDESRFFASNPLWMNLGRRNFGVDSLRHKLSNLLLNHIKRELGDVKREIDIQLVNCREEIAELGDELAEIKDMRKYLGVIAHRYHRLCIEAVWGKYSDASFFGTGFDPRYDDRYLRSVIRNLNEEFACIFWKYGHSIEVEGSRLAPASDDDETTYVRHAEGVSRRFDSCFEAPKELTRNAAVTEWARPTTRRARGEEIGDGRNPVLVKLFFCEQSVNWEPLAKQQMKDCFKACRTFLHLVLDQVAPVDFQTPLREWIEEKMNAKLHQASLELSQVLLDVQCRHPIINEYQYRSNVNMARARRATQRAGLDPQTIIESLLHSASAGGPSGAGVFDMRQACEILGNMAIESSAPGGVGADDNEDYRCEQSLDEMLAYYKGARTRFVDDVIVQVVERHLVGELFDIFTAADVSAMSDEQIRYIADESPAKAAKRVELSETLRGLQEGAAICRKFGRHIPER